MTLHIRVSEDTAAALREMAEADSRKLAPFIALVLDRYVAEHAPEPKPKRGGK